MVWHGASLSQVLGCEEGSRPANQPNQPSYRPIERTMETSHLRHTLCIVVHDRIPAFSLTIYTFQTLPLSIHTLTRNSVAYMYITICIWTTAQHETHVKFARIMRLRVSWRANYEKRDEEGGIRWTEEERAGKSKR